MSDNRIQFRKKREPGEIFADSFQFIKVEYRNVLPLIIRYVLPFIVVYGILQAYVQTKFIGKLDISDPELLLANIGPFYLNILLASLFGLFVQSLLAGTYYTYIKAYVLKGKGNFQKDEITPTLFNNTLLALGANLVLFIVVMFGTIMCILPGIFLANTLSLTLMIVVFEGKGLSNALTRSWNLVLTQWWQTLLICILGVLIIYAAIFISSIPLMFDSTESNSDSLQSAAIIDFQNLRWLWHVVSTTISSLFYIVPYTFLAFQYFNLDERNKILTSGE